MAMESAKDTGKKLALDYFKKGLEIVNDYRLLWVFSLFVMFPFYIGPATRPGKAVMYLQEISPILGLAGLGAVFLLSLLRILASAGLIEVVKGYTEGRKAPFGEILKKGGMHYWPMFLLHLLMGAIFIGAILAMGLVIAFFRNTGFGGLCFNIILGLILLAFFLAMLISLGVAFAFAERYLVLADTGVVESWRKGFGLYNRHRNFALRLGALQASFWFITFFVAVIPLIILSGAPTVRNLVIGILLVIVNIILGSTFHTMYTSAWFDLKESDSKPEKEPPKPAEEATEDDKPEQEPAAETAEEPEEIDNP
jgi:hypothetical protein